MYSTTLRGDTSIVALYLACFTTVRLPVMCREPTQTQHEGASHRHCANFAVVQLAVRCEMQSDVSEFHMLDCLQPNCCSITFSPPPPSTFTEATHIKASE